MTASQPDTQPAVAQRAAEAQVRGLIAKVAPAHQRLIGAVRRSLRKRLPTGEGILALRASADGVKLYFYRGTGLPDPEKLLRGSGNQTRWIALEGASTPKEAAAAPPT